MRRDLFVFAGQSNMMGAAVYPPKNEICVERSYEYKHNPRRSGKPMGNFVMVGYPVGEFSYVDMQRAYAPDMIDETGKSKLSDYRANTYFCPSMSSLVTEGDKNTLPFSAFSEATAQNGATLAPFIAEEWEKLGYSCAYAHIAKGSIRITHYMTEDMAAEYSRRMKKFNQVNDTCFAEVIPSDPQMVGAADYFLQKCKDFFKDAKVEFPNDDMPTRCFFWLQGEGDADNAAIEYETKLDILWDKLKEIGFTHFFCIRVDFFGVPEIVRVMEAQELFTEKHADAYMLTRAASYFAYAGRDEDAWFISSPEEEYKFCRDSFYGYENQHINEKGFSVIAKHAVKNLYRILIDGKEPLLEAENIRLLK